MDSDLLLNSNADRRPIKEVNDVPPGPPGVESDASNFDQKTKRLSSQQIDKDRRRSVSKSPRRRSVTRSGRSPLTRSRRSPSPYRRRNRRSRSRNHSPMRGRNYSPDRRRFSGGGRARARRFSPDRRRDISRERERDRRHDDRFRGRSGSGSPQRRWSPHKKPSSPPAPPPLTQNVSAQYNVQPQMFTGSYGYQYSSSTFQPTPDYISAPPPPPFSNNFPMTQPTWGISSMGEEYDVHQPTWPAQPLPMPSICASQELEMIQPPPQLAPPDAVPDLYKKKAVEKEAQNQREEFRKQRDDYLDKANKLKDNIKALKDQRKDLKKVTPLTPHTKAILDENERLQNQMQKRLITIDNVIDMLSGIIGEENIQPSVRATSLTPLPEINENANAREDMSPKSTSSSRSSSSSTSKSSDVDSASEKLKKQVIESMRSKREERETTKVDKKTKDDSKPNEDTKESKKINYDFYDPETYWCQKCKVFPQNAKLYLMHLHSKEHLNNSYETPWRDKLTNEDNTDLFKGQTKPYPIRGLQFFIPSKSWYCKLCNFWMGDMHCASFHLKSNTHCSNYLKFINQNPNFESDWMAERQKAFDLLSNASPPPPPPPQISSMPPTSGDILESIPLQIGKRFPLKNISELEKVDEKSSSKKSKKKSDDKKDKKKKKRSKKRKKIPSSSSSSNSESSFESHSDSDKVMETNSIGHQDCAVSVRVAMRNLNKEELILETETKRDVPDILQSALNKNVEYSVNESKWATENKNIGYQNNDDDGSIELQNMSQWNNVQPNVTESDIKMFANLKKNVNVKIKPPSTHTKLDVFSNTLNNDISSPNKSKKENTKTSPKINMDKNRRSRSRGKRVTRRNDLEKGSYNKDHDRVRERSRSRGRLSKSRARHSKSRDRHSRSRERRSRSRDRRRSRSRGRFRGNRRSRGRLSPAYGRRRKRSQSNERRRKSNTRSRSKSIEKPVVRHLSEFRPRVPENKKGIKTKTNDENEHKKSPSKKVSSVTTSTSVGKKLPFIGRMPVFKKQTQNNETFDKKDDKIDDLTSIINQNEVSNSSFPVTSVTIRHSLDLQQRETLYEPQFDPNMMVDYDDLMPDPVQFISLMGAPPPPPSSIPPSLASQYTDDTEMLPPGIDEGDAECVPKPISDAPIPRKGPLPKDFEEALNIIFPGEKIPEVEKKSTGETTVINETPVMHPQDLAKEGIHIMSIEETTEAAMDKTSQLSMNEPLVFNIPSNIAQISSKNQEEQEAELTSIDHVNTSSEQILNSLHAQKAPSPTPSEKRRRKEELDDLAMLGIDADDLAAQCI